MKHIDEILVIVLSCFVIYLMYGIAMLDNELKQCNSLLVSKDKLITEQTIKGLNKELGQ